MEKNRKTDELKVLCFGMGAIGTYIGGSLANAGASVVFIERPEFIPLLQSKGISLEIDGKETSVQNIQIKSDAREVLQEQVFDVALLAVKSFDTTSVLNNLSGIETNCPPILCLQNGVENEQMIAAKIGENKVIAGTITSAVGKKGPGSIRLEKMRGVGIETGHPDSEKLLNWFCRAGLNAKGYRNRGNMKWSKMLTNLLANASSAILDWTPQQVFSNPISYRLEVNQIKEAIEVMNALGYHVIDLPGTPVKPLMSVLRGLPVGWSQKIVGIPLAKARGAKMPSFHIDLYSDRNNSEVSYLNGAVVRFGKALNISTPVNSILTDTLERLASGEIDKAKYIGQPEKLLDIA